jgi:hypothetical protein
MVCRKLDLTRLSSAACLSRKFNIKGRPESGDVIRCATAGQSWLLFSDSFGIDDVATPFICYQCQNGGGNG